MKFEKGKSKTGGRAKGVPNKFTTLKEAFLTAFQEAGSTEGLIAWIKASPHNRAQFYALITKLFPTEVDHTGQVEHAVNVKVTFVDTKG
jgi:hypothetical protein